MTAMHEDLVDAVRSPVILIYMFIVLPITLAVAPLGDTVELDFHAYRLQHFDLQGTQYGSRGWRVMYEAAALDSKTLLRRCLVTLWRDLVNRDLSQTFDKTLGAALIIIPADLDALSGQDRQLFLEFERQLVSQAYDVAVYVAPSTPQLRETLVSLQTAQRHEQSSAFSALLHAVTANSFQITSDFQGSSVKLEQPLFNVVGKLSAFERSSDVSTIAIVAHYDSFGAAPALSFGADSNGSGVAALLELMRILHRFYQTAKTRAKYNLVFLLSSGGKLNYQGSRQWIEEFLEATQNIEGSSGALEMAICLDSLAKGSALRMHVSKVPADTAPANRFLAHLRRATTVRFGANRSVDVVAKKINLGADFLSWEHERFNIRRLAALTLSHFESPTDPMRRSLLDTPGQVDLDALTANVQVIAEALLRHIYDLPDGASTSSDNSAAIFLDDTAGVQKDRLQSWIERLTSSARASQIVVETGKKNPLLADFLSTFDHYAHEAQLVPVNVDKKDPEFVLYGAVDDRLAAYRVKPAVFELVLATLIAAYLGLVYFAVLNAQSVLQYVQCHAIKYKTS